MNRRRKLRMEKLETRALLATFVVNTYEDTQAVDLVTGQDTNGNISLRSAIMASNAQATVNKIVLPAPTWSSDVYRLTLSGRNEDFAATGDLDIYGQLTIEGNGARIDGAAVDRVFEVMTGANLVLKNISIDGGEAVEGGAIYNRARLTVRSSEVNGIATAEAPFTVKGGSLFNANGGVVNAVSTIIYGRAFGGNGVTSTTRSQSGEKGGDAVGGAIYNLGKVYITGGGGVSGIATAGRGADGAAGTPGRDANGLTSSTDGTRGGDGGNGGVAQGGAVYNGPNAVFQYNGADPGGLSGEAFAGAGGNGGAGGKGGDAGYWRSNGASGLWSPGGSAPGGRGGHAGDAMGGAIYNDRGRVTLGTTSQNPNSYFQIIERAMASIGGSGGDGGSGGAGASDGTPDGARVSGSSASMGGNAGNGGSAYGGAIYSTGGTVQLSRVSIPGESGNIGAYAGQNGFGGQGGTDETPPDVYRNLRGSDGIAGKAEGGAFRIKAGTLTVTDSEINGTETVGGFGNANSAWGGGFNISGGNVTIQNSTVSNHTVTGGYFQMDIPDVVFGGPGATGGSAYGGAVWMTAGSLNVVNSTLANNSVIGSSGASIPAGLHAGSSVGAGIGMSGGSVNIVQSTIRGGKALTAMPFVPWTAYPFAPGANGGNALGGGIYATGGTLTVSNSTISDNQVISSPGTIGAFSAPVGKAGTAFGAGVYLTKSNASISNTTIYGNLADSLPALSHIYVLGAARGGGIYHAGTGAVTLNHLTVANNVVGSATGTTNAAGGGIYNGTGTVQIQNSIVAQNSAGAALSWQRDIAGTLTSLGYNLIGVRNNTTVFVAAGDRSGSSAKPLVVGIAALEDNGGPTLTCRLLVNSIAINAADPLDTTLTDQRGVARPVNGRADIGAFEYLV